MTTFPGSPRLLRGTIVAVDPLQPVPDVIVFQYNPDTVTRTLQAQAAGGEEGGRSEAMRLKGAPVETVKLEVEIDATDRMETGAGLAGVYPQLAALEMLIYPASARVVANTALMALGTIEVVPPRVPLTLFVWGPSRVVPVRLTDFSVTEEAHDTSLNPIRARVSLGLRVLSYDDLPPSDPGHNLFLAHQIVKETMARASIVNSLDVAAGGAGIGLS